MGLFQQTESRNAQAKLTADLQELKSEAARLEEVKKTAKRQIVSVCNRTLLQIGTKILQR